jgi:enoyl-[acyl-carrier protein] reductase II
MCAEECTIHPAVKEQVLKAKDRDTIVTGRVTGGAPVRVLKNKMAREYIRLTEQGASREELEKLTLGSLRRAVFDGDVDTGSFMAGQVAGMIKEIRPVQVIIESLFAGIENFKNNLQIL